MRSFRVIWLLCGLTVVLLLGISMCVAFGRPHRVNRVNFDKIQEGMTVAEVEALLGRGSATRVFGHGSFAVLRIHEYSNGDNFWLIPSDRIEIHFSGSMHEKLHAIDKKFWSPSPQNVWQHVRNRIMKALGW
jgi:hypothetical protein